MGSAKRLRVLVLEDEWMIAMQIEAALADSGMEVVGPVGRIEEALLTLETHPPDAAILDINIHGERSFRVAERLIQTSTPFLFLSGYSATELPSMFRGRPLLMKPVVPSVLCDCIEALVRH